jgi:hypothetical protein
VFTINYHGCNVNRYGAYDGGLWYAEVIGSSYDGTDETLSPCVAPESNKVQTFVYFATFILFSAMVLVSALVGIIVTSMQNAQAVVQRALNEQERATQTSHYFKLKDVSIDATVNVFKILDGGFTGALTPELLLDKMRLLDVPTNDAFVHRAFDIANKMTDKPFDCADFLLLVGLAERAVMLQEKLGDSVIRAKNREFTADKSYVSSDDEDIPRSRLSLRFSRRSLSGEKKSQREV